MIWRNDAASGGAFPSVLDTANGGRRLRPCEVKQPHEHAAPPQEFLRCPALCDRSTVFESVCDLENRGLGQRARSGSVREVVRPCPHQFPTSSEQVRVRIGRLDLALGDMRQTRFVNFARLANLPAPIAE